MFLLFHLFLYFWYASATLHLAVLWIHIFLTYHFFFFYDKKWFWGLREYYGYLVIEIFYETTWKWTMYFKYINLWAFEVGLPWCYNIGDYLVFVMMFMWHVITPSLWQRARLDPLTLHDAGKSLRVWVRPLSIGPKDHMQKVYYMTRHSLPSMRGRGKSISV